MKTLLPLEQVRLVSTNTGSHILDTYIEESEKGGRTLPDLLDDLFLPDGTLAVNLEMRYNGPNIEYRYGVFTDPEEGWTAFLKFHQWEGEYLSGYDYLAGDVVSYGNGIIYFVEDYPNAPATPNPTTDPKMVWIIDDAFISAILSEMSTLKSDTQTLNDDTQTLHDNAAQILIDVTAIESNIEAMELNIASMESNVTTLETQTQTAKTAAEAAQAASELAASNAATSETNAANSASESLGHSNQAEIHKDTAETAAQTAINATDSKYDKTGGDITGDVNISGSLTIGGDEVWDAGNFNPANYLPLAGGTVTGDMKVEGVLDTLSTQYIDNQNPSSPNSKWKAYAWGDQFQINRRDVVTGDHLSTSLALDYDNPDDAYINNHKIYTEAHDSILYGTVLRSVYSTSATQRIYFFDIPELPSGSNNYFNFQVYAYEAFGNLNNYALFEVSIVARGSWAANGLSIRVVRKVSGNNISIDFYYRPVSNGHRFYIHFSSTYSGIRVLDTLADNSIFKSTNGLWQKSDSAPNSSSVLLENVENWTSINYQPERVTDGLGVVRLMLNRSGTTIAHGGTVSGSKLRHPYWIAGNGTTWEHSSTATAGTWKNVSITSCPNGHVKAFVRIS